VASSTGSGWRLKGYANGKGIRIVGDIPIFIAFDSADAWANPELYYFDEEGNPEVVSGVPPDYFSATGQRWGNPIYRWKRMEKKGFAWWVSRFRSSLEFYDLIRVDHFRGFESYWEIPAENDTARDGRWVKGPGQALFDALKKELGELPIIAEDLGVITPGVERLRDDNGLPGMKVLQFAFAGGGADPYLPHNYAENCVVYTGTHDNDTTQGWFRRGTRGGARFCPALPGPGRRRGRLGTRPAGVHVGRPLRGGAAARRLTARFGGADEHAGGGGRKLGLALS
jgi:4-alpha-glucanotransferase